MPCMGPTQPTDEEVDRVMARIMGMLWHEYGVMDPVGTPMSRRPLDEHWHEAKDELREAVKKMLYADACSSW